MKIFFLVLAAVVFIGALPAMAVPFTFTDIPSDDNPGLDLSSNFSGEISGDNDQVMFTIFNDAPDTATIASVFFEYTDDLLLTNGDDVFSQDDSSEGVFFKRRDNLNLPQGENISFTADFAMTAIPDAPDNGINIGEFGAFLFNGNVDNILLAINQGDLRIGLHVINIGKLSDSYVSSPVPEPTTMLLLGIGLIGITLINKKNFP